MATDAPPLPLAAAHAEARATFEPAAGLLLPAWYGDDPVQAAAREYAVGREGAALLDLAERGVLAVTGPVRQKFLHSVLSNDVASLRPGEGCLAALMDVKGHLQALLRVLVATDVVWLETAADRLAVLEAALVHYRVAAPVRLQVKPTAVLGLLGPGARDVLARAGFPVPELQGGQHVPGALDGLPVLTAGASDLPRPGLVLHLAPETAAPAWDALRSAGAVPIGRRAFDALRVEDGCPWYGIDVTEKNLLHETGLLRQYHSSGKGCYPGQEVVARLEGRGGHVNKRLVGLRLASPVRSGATVLAEGKPVGRVTTAALSPRLGPVAMAYLHRSRSEPGTTVEVEGGSAVVQPLPMSTSSSRT